MFVFTSFSEGCAAYNLSKLNRNMCKSMSIARLRVCACFKLQLKVILTENKERILQHLWLGYFATRWLTWVGLNSTHAIYVNSARNLSAKSITFCLETDLLLYWRHWLKIYWIPLTYTGSIWYRRSSAFLFSSMYAAVLSSTSPSRFMAYCSILCRRFSTRLPGLSL